MLSALVGKKADNKPTFPESSPGDTNGKPHAEQMKKVGTATTRNIPIELRTENINESDVPKETKLPIIRSISIFVAIKDRPRTPSKLNDNGRVGRAINWVVNIPIMQRFVDI